jgi:AcrR family transcriptional regulator
LEQHPAFLKATRRIKKMARRSEHTQEQIKEMVLKAAETLVIDEGFAALKVREIAMEIGYTVGSIYMVFDNMADLILQVKGRTLDDLAIQLAHVSTAQAPEQQLIALTRAYLNFAQQNFNRWSMIFEHRLSPCESLPVWYLQKIDAIFNRIETLFGQLAPQTESSEQKRAAQALWCGIHGVCILSLTGTETTATLKDIEDNVLLLAHSFIKGWLN